MSRPGLSTKTQLPGTYTVEQSASLATASTNAQAAHLTSAADIISQTLEGNDIIYSFMGGFSMMLRGSTRRTVDIDIATGCNMQQLIQVLSAQAHILRPSGPVSGVMRIFIKTGGGSNTILPELHVMADLILQGTLGAPSNLTPHSIETITTETPLGERTYPILNTQAILNSKLNAFHQRSEAKDYLDIIFLIQKFGEEVHAFRGELDQEHRMTFINSYAGKNPGAGGLNKVRKVKFMLGVA